MQLNVSSFNLIGDKLLFSPKFGQIDDPDRKGRGRFEGFNEVPQDRFEKLLAHAEKELSPLKKSGKKIYKNFVTHLTLDELKEVIKRIGIVQSD